MNKDIPFSELVNQEWTLESTVAAWRRWHPKMRVQLGPMTQALMAAVEVRPGTALLDLASGSGEPAITLAGLVGADGSVTATDLSPEMLALAEENARNAGRAGNMTFRQADVHDLPFMDRQFDLVTSRLGVMYFWDCPRAMGEIRRVLKPGGRAAFVAWGGFAESGLQRTMLGPIFARHQPPPPPPDAPHPFRFAEPGSLSQQMRAAGFVDIRESQETISCPWPGSPEELWNHIYEVAVPLQPVIDALSPEERNAARQEAIAEFAVYYDGEVTDPTTRVVVAVGQALPST